MKNIISLHILPVFLLPDTVCKIAVNGNPLFADEYFGIPQKTRQIFKDLNLDNYMDFRKKYLVINDEELAYFNQNASERSFESCFDELEKLEKLAENNKKIMNFDTAILSDSDRIFNPAIICSIEDAEKRRWELPAGGKQLPI